MFCIECGQELPANAKFCSHCGTAVSTTSKGQTTFMDDVAMKAQEMDFSGEDNSSVGSFYDEITPQQSAKKITNTPVFDTQMQETSTKVVDPVMHGIIHTGSYMSLLKEDNNQYCFYNPTTNTYSEYYEDARASNYEGFACVKINGYWGAIDRNFRMVVPAIYEYVWTFFEGYAVVQRAGKYGVVNTQGEEVIPIKYDSIGLKSNGIVSARIDDKFGYINIKGEEVIPLRKYEGIWACYEGLHCVIYNGKYGFLSEKGYEIPCIYDDADSFRNGYAKVVINGETKIIDKLGNYVELDINNNNKNNIQHQLYDDIEHFSEGYAVVSRRGKYGYIDTQGRLVIDLKFDTAGSFHNGGACVGESKWFSVQVGFIDKFGNYIVAWNRNKGFIPSEWLGNSGVVYDSTTEKYGCIDKNGNIIIPIKYDNISGGNDFHVVSYQGKEGVFDKHGREKISISEGYDRIYKSDDVWSLYKNGKWGFYDSGFKLIIPHRYENNSYCNRFIQGYAHVTLNGRCILIDKNGVEYEYVEGYDASVFA